jgi:uncharacterized membrane protein
MEPVIWLAVGLIVAVALVGLARLLTWCTVRA